MQYDVVIAGAGIPGLFAARELAKKGLKTIIIELEKDPGDPNYSTAGITTSTIREFSLPVQSINSQTHKIIYGTGNTEATWQSNKPVAYVIDFRKTKILLADEVTGAGGEVKWDTKAVDLIYHDGKAIGVNTSRGDLFCKYIIDATGSTGQLAVQAGIREKNPGKVSVGIEYIVKDKEKSLGKYYETIAIYLDTGLAPYGYAWVFHDGNEQYKVGICEGDIDPKRNLPSLEDRLDNFLSWICRKKNVEIIEKHGGSKFLTNNFPKVRSENVLAIGDAIGAINPLLGEGIRHGLYSAKFALEAIKESEAGGDLSSYEISWKKYKGIRWFYTRKIAEVYYLGNLSAKQKLFEKFVEFCKKNMGIEDVLNFVFEYKLGSVLGKFPAVLPVLIKTLTAFLR